MVASLGGTPVGRVLHGLCVQGKLGVPLFYMLSAFTLYHSLESRKGRDLHPIRAFFLRRFLRIAPLFWVATALSVAWYGLGPRWCGISGISYVQIALTFCMAHGLRPDSINSVVNGGWSVGVEVLFYCLLPVIHHVAKTPRQVGGLLIFSLILAIALAVFNVPGRLFPELRSSVNMIDLFSFTWLPNQLPVFLLGLLLYTLERSTRVNDARSNPSLLVNLDAMGWFVLGVVIASASSSLIGTHEPSLTQASVLALGIWWLSIRPIPLLVNRFTEWVGRISYGTYLFHVFGLDLAVRLFGIPLPESHAYMSWHAESWVPVIWSLASAPTPVRLVAVVAVALPVTFALASLGHVLVEKPMMVLVATRVA
jgi:peptidoglycan/LPS O-acetylase OafA/YrhL